MTYETTMTAYEVLTDVEEWLLKQNLLPSINDLSGLSGEDVFLHQKIEDLINEDHAYWANCSKWSLYNYAKDQLNK
jgi:hypothetical protein